MVAGLNGQSGLHVTNHAMMVELKDGDIVQILSHFMEGKHAAESPLMRNNAMHRNVLVFISNFLTCQTGAALTRILNR